jgi:hypothetical protein
MSETITSKLVDEAFADARLCASADNCQRMAEAMYRLRKLSNQHTVETGEGLYFFLAQPEGPCPNQDQLFCQATNSTL